MKHSRLDHEDQMFKSEDFSKQSLESQKFNHCVFQNCHFSETSLWNSIFSSCTFEKCHLSLIKLDGCRIQDTQFSDCKIVGADFFKCEKTFLSMGFKSCLIQYGNFTDLNMKNFHFSSCKLLECHFINTILKGSHFENSDLSGTVFHHCDLSKADFSTAFNYAIDPRTNIITKAKFSLSEAMKLLDGFDIILT